MALNSCSSGLVTAAAVVALMLLPTQYLVPYYELAPAPLSPPPPPPPLAALDQMLTQIPPLELFVTVTLFLLAVLIYLCEWIQRKFLEKRIVKLNQYLCASVERLRERDARQEQLEANLKLVRNATSEYKLLLYLLLRQHHCIATDCPQNNCFFDKGLEDVAFLSPTGDA